MGAGCVLFFAYIGGCAPLESDDLGFAALHYETIGEYWSYICQYGNGRFLGNALSIAVAHVPWLWVWGRALILAGCVFLLPKVLGMTSRLADGLSFLLFVAVDGSLFGQVYAWGSGFANYIPPVFLTMVILTLLPAGKRPRGGYICVPAIFLLAVCSQLFMEHSAAVNWLLAMYAVARESHKKSPSRLKAWAWLAGSTLGLAVMLLGPKVFYVPGNYAESYRSIYLGSIREMVTACIRSALRLSTHYLSANSLPLCLGSAATLLLTRHRRSHRANRAMGLMWGVATGYVAFSALHGLKEYYGSVAVFQHGVGFVALALLIGLWAVGAWQVEEGRLREKLLLCVAFGVLSLAPLLVVNPVPERTVFQSYIFFAAGVMLCAHAGKDFLPHSRKQLAILVATAGCAANLCCTYFTIGRMTRLRDAYIREQIAQGAQTIQVFAMDTDYINDYVPGPGFDAYYQDIAGYPVRFEEVSRAVWMGEHGG